MNKKLKRIMIVDDSEISRSMIAELIETAEDLSVVGMSENGRDAVILAEEIKPDLITMDIDMPIMDGLTATEMILKNNPVPIMVISSDDEARTAFKAIACGALELFSKNKISSENSDELIAKVRLLANVKIKPRVNSDNEISNTTTALELPSDSSTQRVIGIASSTGGPSALLQIFSRLDSSFPYPILVAQHIGADFAPELVRWMSKNLNLEVRMGHAGDKILPGTVYISPSEHNMGVTSDGAIHLEEPEQNALYHPSCDYMLNSLAEVYKSKVIGIVLTGMGRDGVKGIESIKRQGGITMAQDEASSVVFGMNALAINSGHVDRVRSLSQIALDLSFMERAK